MKMGNMTIAKVQYHMSKSSNRFHCSNWSVNDEIDYHNNLAVPCIPSRSQREGYYFGQMDGKPDFRTKRKFKKIISISTSSSNRKQRKLAAIQNKTALNKMLTKYAWVD